MKDFFSKRDQIRRKLRIWSHLLKKSLMKNFIFCAVHILLSFSSQEITLLLLCYCVKSVRILSYSGPYFPALRLNMEIYEVSFHIHPECGKIRIRITLNTDTLYTVCTLMNFASYAGLHNLFYEESMFG